MQVQTLRKVYRYKNLDAGAVMNMALKELVKTGEKMKIVILSLAVIISGCASTQHTYPKTGNAGVDMAMSNQALSHETKMNILRRYHGEEPVFKDNRPQITAYRPVVDPNVCRDCDYEQDLAQCQEISARNTNVTGNAIAGAAGGAATSALIGAFIGVDPGHMAAMGASVGSLQGVGQELMTSNAMVARCMAGRGYSVLR